VFRLAPPCKDFPVAFDLPEMKKAGGHQSVAPHFCNKICRKQSANAGTISVRANKKDG
jgi:hypothetical protein